MKRLVACLVLFALMFNLSVAFLDNIRQENSIEYFEIAKENGG